MWKKPSLGALSRDHALTESVSVELLFMHAIAFDVYFLDQPSSLDALEM